MCVLQDTFACRLSPFDQGAAMRRLTPVALALIVVALAVVPVVMRNDYIGGVLDTAGAYAIVAVGLNLLSGGTGQFSLGHAGFFAIGAFTAAILSATYGWPFWLGIPAGGILATVAGIIVGVPVLRLSGPYFSIATLGFGLLIANVLSTASWAGGRTGISLNAPQLGPYTFTSTTFFWVVLLTLVIAIYAAYNLRQGATGRAFVALRESEPAAQASGINLARYRVTAFAISALYAGVAGALFAYVNLYVSASSFGLPVSVAFIATIVVGGLDSVAGSIVGAVFLIVVQELLNNAGQAQLAQPLYGAVIVVALLFLPRGLVGLVALLRARRGETAPVAVGGGAHG